MNKQDLIKTTIISLVMSIMCSTATYFITASIINRQIPKFATVDLLGLSNDFLINISKYQLSKGASDEQVAQMVKNYANKIQPLLDDISASGNVMLFQKQAIVTKTQDITPQIAQALFKDYLPNNNSTPDSNLNSNENANGNTTQNSKKITNQDSNANANEDKAAIEE